LNSTGKTFCLLKPIILMRRADPGLGFGPLRKGSKSCAARPLGGHETILLCEDDEAVRRFTSAALSSAGYTVLSAESPTVALQLSATHAGPVHLLATDWTLPEINGRQLAEQLRAARPELRVLYLSGYTAQIMDHQGRLEPGADLLEKPFSAPTLLRRVRDTLDRANGQ